MSYKNMAEVMVEVWTDLNKKRDKAKKALTKFRFRKTFLDAAGVPHALDKEIEKKECELADVEVEISVLEKKITGGASLDNFLDTGKAKSRRIRG